jgi:hypothetical protein
MFFLLYYACAFFLLLNKLFESTSWLNERGNLIDGNFVKRFYINMLVLDLIQ